VLQLGAGGARTAYRQSAVPSREPVGLRRKPTAKNSAASARTVSRAVAPPARRSSSTSSWSQSKRQEPLRQRRYSTRRNDTPRPAGGGASLPRGRDGDEHRCQRAEGYVAATIPASRLSGAGLPERLFPIRKPWISLGSSRPWCDGAYIESSAASARPALASRSLDAASIGKQSFR